MTIKHSWDSKLKMFRSHLMFDSLCPHSVIDTLQLRRPNPRFMLLHFIEEIRDANEGGYTAMTSMGMTKLVSIASAVTALCVIICTSIMCTSSNN